MTSARCHLGAVLPVTSLRAMQSSQPSFFSVSTLCMIESGRKKKVELDFLLCCWINHQDQWGSRANCFSYWLQSSTKLQHHWPHETWSAGWGSYQRWTRVLCLVGGTPRGFETAREYMQNTRFQEIWPAPLASTGTGHPCGMQTHMLPKPSCTWNK